mmetsp:Transcript_9331/g.13887  ORF Transcript_9331/g.13887 Transcript_9331/m.13887 type:complete len:205 (+) Transcript_9331:38-652(+)
MYFLLVGILALGVLYLASVLVQRTPVQSQNEPQKVYRTEECYLCLENIHFEVQTSCGHVYCAHCILELANRSWDLKCPACRSLVSILFCNFNLKEAPSDISSGLARFNVSNSGERSLWQVLYETPVMLKRVLNDRDYLGNWKAWSILLGGAVYLLLPEDFLPESKLGILLGSIDDILTLFLSLVVSGISYYQRASRESAENLVN